jgi:uncharacterized protein with von Willebrand factor type A (vWA) domain
VIADFIRVLRAADVQVSPAEAIDAAAVIDAVGMSDRGLLKHALSHSLAKTEIEKYAFDECFESYFMPPRASQSSAQEDAPEDAQEDGQEESQQNAEAADQEGDEESDAQSANAQQGGEGQNGAPADLTQMLEANHQAALQAAMAEAASAVGVQEARLFTQQGMFSRRIIEAMGLEGLDRNIREADDGGDSERAEKLRQGRAQLFEDIQDFVERQIAMRTKNAGRLLREDALSRIRLSNLDRSDMVLMRNLIRRLAKRLASRHSRRRKKSRRGMLDVRRTLRRNLSFDGALFDLAWRRTKVERPKLIVLCDVSGSVAAVSRFFLMFLYSLDEVMPRTRSFVFSNRAGEISDLMREGEADEVMEQALRQYGGGSTDYGMALQDLAEATLDKIDHRTTVMVLGDARSNYGDPGHLVLKEIHERARRVIWLNPEAEAVWNSGDSEMKRLGAYCTQVKMCNSIRHVERVLDDLLKQSI